MSRITGSDAKALMEAYAAVYAPQEITEEQTWQEVENWVNSLVEEGYDLSEYTWEDMYEAYIEENPKYRTFANDWIDNVGRTLRNLPNAITKPRPGLDAAMNKPRGLNAPRVGNIPPKEGTGKGGPSDTRMPLDPGRFKRENDRLRGVGNPPGKKDGSSGSGSGGDVGAGGSKVAPAATKPVVKQTGDKAKDMATWAKANPTLASKVTAAGTQKGTGQSTMAKQAAELRAMRPATPAKAVSAAPSTSPAASGSVAPATAKLAATPKPTPVAPNRATGSKKPGSAFEQYDAYDVVLEYLFDNGHVDTVDEAHYVMMEMDAEVIQGIVESRAMAHTGGKPHPLQGAGGKPKGITGGKTYQMPGWDDKKQVKGV